jgi:hypothetical protein
MKISGFTFIKNALIYDYPIIEAILSILPLCDELVVAVGKSDDETLALIQGIDPTKIKIIETVWDESLRRGGFVLAEETNKAFKAIAKDSDWCFYIQGDEVMHEKYIPIVREAMLRYKDNLAIDGLVFDYKHFYGSYDYIGVASKWYHSEIRVVRNNSAIYSYKDAQGFRKNEDQKLNVKLIKAEIYHYGWVKEPAAMQKKQETFNKLWHNDEWIENNVVKSDTFDYKANVAELKPFKGTHPEVMKDRILRINWKFEEDPSFNNSSIKDKMKYFLKKYLRLDTYYKNYKVI